MTTYTNTINLQLFAEVQTTLLSGLSPEMKTYYDMDLIDHATPHLVHDQFGQKRPIPAGSGKSIEFRSFAPLNKATTPITEGVTPEGNKLEVTDMTATVAQYGDFITQSDVLELTAIDNTILEATKLLGNQAGVTLDTVVRDVMQTTTNITYCPKVAADGSTTAVMDVTGLDNSCQLTVEVINEVVAKLRAVNAPTIDGDYIAIAHPYVLHDLMSSEAWQSAQRYANPEAIYNGEVGKIGGVRFVQTSEAKIYDNGVFGTLIFGDGAYGVSEITGGGLETIIKQKGSAGTADPLDQRSSVGWKAMKTAKVLVPDYLVKVYSKSKKFSGTAQAN